jgi:hypothetical protein
MPYSPDSRPSTGVKKSLHRLILQLPRLFMFCDRLEIHADLMFIPHDRIEESRRLADFEKSV